VPTRFVYGQSQEAAKRGRGCLRSLPSGRGLGHFYLIAQDVPVLVLDDHQGLQGVAMKGFMERDSCGAGEEGGQTACTCAVQPKKTFNQL
jgi:hypothetical protein